MRLSRSSQRRNRQGAVLVWFVLCLPVVIAVTALCLDGGRLFQERRDVQVATDSAAYAAAVDLYKQKSIYPTTLNTSSAVQAARDAAAANGCTHDGVDTIVSVNIPPSGGDYAGLPDFVEVVIETKVSGSFSQLITQQPITVRTRAVASSGSAGGGIIALNRTAGGSFTVTGNGQIDMPNGNITVNSSAANAVRRTGNSQIDANSIDINGGYSETGGGAINATITTGVPPQPDPLAYLPPPNLALHIVQSTAQLLITTPTTLLPGIYQGGIDISNTATVVFQPGVYIIEGGGFAISGQASIQANGVMIFNSNLPIPGPISLTGQGSIQWTAPTSGTYKGICIFQDRNCTEDITIAGNDQTQVSGTVYAPAAHVKVSGNGSTAANKFGDGYIVNTMQVSGNGYVRIEGDSNTMRSPNIRLVD